MNPRNKNPKQSAEKRGHVGVDLWGPRALSGSPKTAENKRLSRRIQRVRDKREIRKHVCDE